MHSSNGRISIRKSAWRHNSRIRWVPGKYTAPCAFLGINQAQLCFRIARRLAAWLAFVSTRFVMGWGCRQDGTKVLAQFSLRQTSRLGHEVILFRDTCRPAGRNSVVLDGAFIIADHFLQMGAHCVETIVS